MSRCQEQQTVARLARHLVINQYIFEFFMAGRQTHDITGPTSPQDKRAIFKDSSIQIEAGRGRAGRTLCQQAGMKDPRTKTGPAGNGCRYHLRQALAGRASAWSRRPRRPYATDACQPPGRASCFPVWPQETRWESAWICKNPRSFMLPVFSRKKRRSARRRSAGCSR